MASLLRSGKFFRLFSNLTRSFELNNGGRNNNDSLVCARRGEWEIKIHRFVNFILKHRCSAGSHVIGNFCFPEFVFFRSLSAAQLPLKNLNDGASHQASVTAEGGAVDRAIEKVEFDAKKLGRITKEDILTIIERIKQQSKQSNTSIS